MDGARRFSVEIEAENVNLSADACGVVDAELGDAKRESHFGGDATMPVRDMAERLGYVHASLGGAQRDMCQDFYETVVVVVHSDPNTPTRRRRRIDLTAEAMRKIADETK